MKPISGWLISYFLVVTFGFAGANTVAAQQGSSEAKTQPSDAPPAAEKAGEKPAEKAAEKPAEKSETTAPQAEVTGKQIHFADGSSIRVDDVWTNGQDLWYRVGGVTQRIARPVKKVEPIRAVAELRTEKTPESATPADKQPPVPEEIWLLLKGGARMKVDEVTENDEGAWYRRGNFSMFVDRDRIERIERGTALANQTGWKQRDWTSGDQRIDGLIRENGRRFGVDPYLVFCVIEHESHFHPSAVSPKGAMGLMQLMPGTASRFGVRQPFNPAQNIFGGTQYLRDLLQAFRGRLDLALASYNAGEGAVIKYGGNVPPYRETREYVRRITQRYGVAKEYQGKSTLPSRE